MTVNYIKANASGNTTALVTDKFERVKYSQIAAALIAKEELGIEQVGFIEKPENKTSRSRLQMMGGEFCGNASRSFGAYLVLSDPYAPTTGMIKVPLDISGYDGTLTAVIMPTEKNRCIAMIDMPLPQRIIHEDNRYLGKVSVVEFSGIVHIILWDTNDINEKYIIPAKEILKNHNIVSPCIGLMFYNKEKNFLEPVVFVEETKTAVRESSCGSGTAALVCALSSMLQTSIPDLTVNQPGGILSAGAVFDKGIINCSLTGLVEISKPITAEI